MCILIEFVGPKIVIFTYNAKRFLILYNDVHFGISVIVIVHSLSPMVMANIMPNIQNKLMDHYSGFPSTIDNGIIQCLVNSLYFFDPDWDGGSLLFTLQVVVFNGQSSLFHTVRYLLQDSTTRHLCLPNLVCFPRPCPASDFRVHSSICTNCSCLYDSLLLQPWTILFPERWERKGNSNKSLAHLQI